jgi:hypothetical protein
MPADDRRRETEHPWPVASYEVRRSLRIAVRHAGEQRLVALSHTKQYGPRPRSTQSCRDPFGVLAR